MRTISYEIAEMVIAGNIIRHRGIYVARAIWFVCSKLLKIPFFNSRFLKDVQGLSYQCKPTLFRTLNGIFELREIFVVFGQSGICRDCRRSAFEGPVSSVASITSTDMEEGAPCATPVTDVEVLSRTLGSVTSVRKVIHEQL